MTTKSPSTRCAPPSPNPYPYLHPSPNLPHPNTTHRQTSKFRTVTLVTDPDGQEVALRGSPRCYPIWFTSTGDVYTVWSRLPGGEKLQAHLSDLYERRMFKVSCARCTQ